MKKLIGTLAITALAVSVFAQGTITIDNQTGRVKQWTSATDSTLKNVPAGGGFVELVAAPSGASLASALGTYDAKGFTPTFSSLSAFLAANTAAGWQIPAAQGGNPIVPIAGLAGAFSGPIATIGNISAGGSAVYAIIGWSGNYASYDAAVAAAGLGATVYGGISGVIATGTGNPNSVPAGLPVDTLTTFPGMTLAPIVVPEPTSFALAGLGLAALLAFRRRS